MTMLVACAPTEVKQIEVVNDPLQRGQELLAQGDFSGALGENREVLDRFPDSPPGDEALYNMALIHVHFANPKRDMGLARVFFARLEMEFPESPRAMEAKVWGSILETLATKTQQAEIEKKRKAQAEQENALLQRGQRLLAQGDFAGALRENQEMLARFPKTPPGDAALFNMGLIHVHYANPKKDIGQARTFFVRLTREFPESPRTEEARTWAGILETMAKTRQIDIEIEEKKRELRR